VGFPLSEAYQIANRLPSIIGEISAMPVRLVRRFISPEGRLSAPVFSIPRMRRAPVARENDK